MPASKNPFQDKEVKIEGNSLITNWRDLKIAQPENLQDKLVGPKETGEEIGSQKEIKTSTSNFATV